MRTYLIGCWLLAIGVSCAPESINHEQTVESTPPNLVFVFADQWRADVMGYAGNTDVHTPHLDQLAEESLVFENAVAIIPVCAPWRASFLTGQYPLTNGLFYNDKPLPTQAVTIGKVFKEAGYQTGYIGKWHVNGHQRGEDPFSGRNLPVPKERRQGFDYWKVREVTHDYNSSYYFDENDEKHFWEGYDVFPQTDSAVSYFHKNKDNPFFLVLSYGPPHDPYFTAPQEYQEMYAGVDLALRPNVPEMYLDSAKRVLAGYYAHCTAIDKAVGNLLQGLEDAGIADNTIFVFTSDHGDMLMSRGVLKKQRPWDESIMVPMLLRWPAKLGTTRRDIYDPINTPDLAPTLLGLCGIDIPESMEGEDFSAALFSGEDLGNEAALITLPVPFHEWQFMNGGREYRGIRTRKYTYVKDLLGPWLLYDNEQDPYQLTNLVNVPQYAQVKAYLETVLNEKLLATQDEFLPADTYMRRRAYLYDRKDSLRPANYLEVNRD
ncbi:MAG: sulfatase [Lunatimonas sp.]|uniref:sulfatase family protein n=1 Tax=Lunatimonas sp. TaxID=2060141 RepID=UPI00263B9593|nr:sulfatase [Lunatimonas sp.]MCC5939160.1 sulfatase [Lunatimonas sp.]